jgi:hypothetical protein
MNADVSIRLPQKPSFEEFVKTCTPLYRNPSLEREMEQKVESIVSDLFDFESDKAGEELLAEFLRRKPEFLGVVLAMANLSQEKFLRILSAERFLNHDYGSEWNADRIYNKLKTDSEFATRIARLFIEGKSNPLLASQIADFYLSQLYLQPNWQEVIRDKNVIGNIVRKKLSGEYTDRKGDYVERLLRARLQALEDEYGVTFTKGQVPLLGKEVDHVVPSIDDPYILIMSSYMETTSSGQTARANEQQAMFAKLGEQHTRYGKEVAFVNVVDGAGWLARRSDLEKLYRGCDFCLNISTLAELDAIVFKYVPEQYFTKKEKPNVETV